MIKCRTCKKPRWRFRSLARQAGFRCWPCYVESTQHLHSRKSERLYSIWCSMKTRCYNPHCKSYRYYGGRGITICETWRCGYPAFKRWALRHGYANHLTLDRKQNSLGYFPLNCRWVTRKRQSRGRNNVTPPQVVLRIKKLLRAGNTQSRIRRLTGVSKYVVSKIHRRKTFQ